MFSVIEIHCNLELYKTKKFKWNAILSLGFKATDLPGHGAFSHFSVSRPFPTQFFPPIWGIGELQRRMRVIFPTPQVTEHEDQGDQ